MSDDGTGGNVWDDDGPEPTDDDLDAALCCLARTRFRVFAQYVLRNEQPDLTGVYDAGDEADWAASLFAEMETADDGEIDDSITLQPYHVELCDLLQSRKNIAVTAHVESGKTQLGIAYILWRLGLNARVRAAVVSEGSKLAQIICRTIARYIADESFSGCQALRRVFPGLLPGKKWSEADGFEVVRPASVAHPSFAAFGSDTGITGYRVDVAMLDDYCTPTTTATPYLRAKQVDTFNRTVYGRVTGHGQRIFFCNAQWSDDVVAQFEAKPGVVAFRMQVTTDGTADGPLSWPEKWPRWRVVEAIGQNPDYQSSLFAIRREIGKYGRFNPDDIRAALHAGRGLTLGGPCPPLLPGAMILIGVDFAFANTRKSDRSAIVVILSEAPQPGDAMGRRRVLDIIADKWDDATGLAALREVIARYPQDRLRVRAESNSGQKFIVQSWGRRLGQTLEPYRTDGTKWKPETGIPALAAAFGNGLYVLPSDQFGHPLPMVAELIREMNRVDPSRAGLDHTGDILMALFFAEGLAMDVKRIMAARFISRGSEEAEPEEETPPTPRQTPALPPPKPDQTARPDWRTLSRLIGRR